MRRRGAPAAREFWETLVVVWLVIALCTPLCVGLVLLARWLESLGLGLWVVVPVVVLAPPYAGLVVLVLERRMDRWGR